MPAAAAAAAAAALHLPHAELHLARPVLQVLAEDQGWTGVRLGAAFMDEVKVMAFE